MRLLVGLALAMLAFAPPRARAVALFFSSPGPGDVPGVVRVDMWFEDPSRDVELYALQFDVDIVGASYSTPPGVQLPNTDRGNELYGGDEFPFDLMQAIGDPAGPNDIRTVVTSSDVLDIGLLTSQVAAYPDCRGDACALQELGLELDRLYLGSFKLAYDASATFLKVNNIFVDTGLMPQDRTDPILVELRLAAVSSPYCDDARGCRIEGLAPEPRNLALIGVALATLGAARQSSRGCTQRNASEPSLGT